MVRAFMALLVLVTLLGALAPAARAGEVNNDEGKYDGLHTATVENRTKNLVTEGIEVDVEGRHIEVRLPSGARQMRIYEIWDRHYMLEITARDQESHDTYIVKIKT